MPQTVDASRLVHAGELPKPSLCWYKDKPVVLHAFCPLSHCVLGMEFQGVGPFEPWKPVALRAYELVEPYDPKGRPLPPGCADYGVKFFGLAPEVDLKKVQYAFSCRTSSTVEKSAGGIRRGRPTSARLEVAGHPSPGSQDYLVFRVHADQHKLTLSSCVEHHGSRGEVVFTYEQLRRFLESDFKPEAEDVQER